MEDLTGRQFSSYQIIAPLGEGGMAAVYKAYQPSMDRYIALKVLPRHFADDPQFTSRFQREAKLLAQLQHPHILPVFDYGQADGYSYIVMPFIQGGTLTDLLKDQSFSLQQIRLVITQVAGALNYAHSHGLIHRDVKPSNVLIDESGNCLLSDFGLARMVETSTNLTASGATVGTPAYMSPEQGSGLKLDARSDIYSLGIILYEMATGRTPYRAETPIAIIIKHINDPLPPPRTINPQLSEALERVILKALAKNPEDRFQTASEMIRAVEAASASEAEVVPVYVAKTNKAVRKAVPPMMDRVKTWQTSRGKVVLVGSAVVVMVLLGFLFSRISGNSPIVGSGETTSTAAPTSTGTAIGTARPTQTAISTRTPIPTATPILPGAVLFEEDFEDGKADGLIRTEAYGKVASDDDGNKVYEVDTTPPDIHGATIEFGSQSWTNYAIEYRVKMLNPEADIWVNFRSNNQVFYIQRLSLGYDHAGLYSNLSENPWQPLAEPNYNVILGVWYLVRIEAQGEVLRVFVNDELIIERTDSKISAGNVAIGNLGHTHALFDDIRVTALGETVNVTPALTSDATPIVTYLSDLTPTRIELGWGTFSAGAYTFSSSADHIKLGDPILLDGVKYPHGIYAHAPSRIVYKLENKFDEFNTIVGLEWGSCSDGVIFIVQLDGVEIYRSLTFYGSITSEIQLSVANGNELSLIVDDGPLNNYYCDWAIWGDPSVH